MNSLFFTRLYSPHIGGVEKHVEKISQILKKKHSVTIITEQYDKKLKQEETIKGIKVHRLAVAGVPEKHKKLAIWKELWKHKQLIKLADLIHVHDVFFWYMPFRTLFPQKPVYTTFHGWEGIYPPDQSAIRMRKLAAKLSHGTIAIGKYIEKWYQTHADVISYGATDLSQRLMGPWPKTPSILVFGRLSRDNDVDLVIKALKQVKKIYQDIAITFLGEGELRQQAKQVGQVTGYDLNTLPYLSKASLVITSSYLSILDSLAAGRRVIAVYSNPLKKDYLKTSPMAKYIDIVSSSGALAKKIEQHLKHPRKSSQNSIVWVKQQTWQKLVNQYLKLWRR